ncbi:WhiB family transcriptional regulator [Nocardiopsis sp. HUAS JQ3]|uniref:WhiB family transcriptional regulator n=1 Tax=Nocardiopsis sp. HUAS JQ3 TaxID=3061629 RepID=UPI0023A9A9A8|nr:WhiB family transcriptional regulator [Nocardiopsis sp. HUAS JQ3]WDZ90599.1 WhiB family transcriptional regulator [Nocardiopsis sp. HUAS JQ3]
MTASTTARTPCQDLTDPDRLFGNALQQRRARHICAPCPVRLTCLAQALDLRVDTGLWGGMTHSERQALRRRHPEVDDWRVFLIHNLLTTAREDSDS